MTKKRIHLIYSIVLSAALIVAGLCLMAACVGIYNSGDRPFSREAVAAAFAPIAVPVYVCLALLIGGLILDIFFPAEKAKKPVEKQYDVILDRLCAKLDQSRCDASLQKAILAQRKSRQLHSWISIALLAVCSIIFLCYGTNSENFHQSQINGSMVKAMWVFIPCLAVPFAYAVFTAFHKRGSIRKEIELVKQALAEGGQADISKPEAPARSHEKALMIGRCAIVGIGIVILLFGFFTGGTVDVLTKAVNICTECVGLG